MLQQFALVQFGYSVFEELIFNVICVCCLETPPECNQGQIRLVGGQTSLQGRVEVCNDGMWGTVCDDLFSGTDAQVACRQLGFSPTGRQSKKHWLSYNITDALYLCNTGATSQCCATYGQGTGSIVLDNLGCTGTESSLFDCPHNGLNTHNCAHSEDVGITCAGSLCMNITARFSRCNDLDAVRFLMM